MKALHNGGNKFFHELIAKLGIRLALAAQTFRVKRYRADEFECLRIPIAPVRRNEPRGAEHIIAVDRLNRDGIPAGYADL